MQYIIDILFPRQLFSLPGPFDEPPSEFSSDGEEYTEPDAVSGTFCPAFKLKLGPEILFEL